MWWKLAAGAVVLALAGFLITLYGKARFNEGQLVERTAWHKLTAQREREVKKLELANERRVSAATQEFARRLAEVEPIIIRSKETVTRYAQTPAGRALCLTAERVHGIEADRSALFPLYSSPSVGGVAPVSADADAPG